MPANRKAKKRVLFDDIRSRLDDQMWARIRAFQEKHPQKSDSILVRDALKTYLDAMELEDAKRADLLSKLSPRNPSAPGRGVYLL